MSLRLLAVTAEFALGASLIGWGIAVTARPSRWNARAARWWVGWTHETVPRVHGVAVATVGAGIVVSAIAVLRIPGAAAIPPGARVIQLAGLGVVLLGGILLAATHPAAPDDIATHPGDDHQQPDLTGPDLTQPVHAGKTSIPTPEAPPALAAGP